MSEVKVNKISPRSGTGVQLGDSGDTITIPAGATINNQGTATNFGATGSASWVTTVKTSSPFTAVAGEGYFVNTTAGAITVNLPAGTAGAVVAIKDYAKTFDTNQCILVPNGSDKIGGSSDNAFLTTEGLAVTLVFIDSTQGWLVTDSGLQSEAPGIEFVAATGGTVTTSGNFKIHTFTSPGTFTVSNQGNSAGSNSVDYLVVAGGGGGGGANHGGGGGAGGYRESGGTASGCYTVSPLGSSPSPVAAIVVSATGYPISVGSGGTGGTGNPGGSVVVTSGSNSIFSSITSAGGGYGGNPYTPPSFGPDTAGNGGSGGGAYYAAPIGTGNTPPTTPPQGNNGGSSAGSPPSWGGGGGGGATTVGGNGNPTTGGAGGSGATSSINTTPTVRGGGGGGSAYGSGTGGAAGPGGGGAGKSGPGAGTAGTVNTGGGGGSGSGSGPAPASGTGGNGGSGIVILRYKFQ